MLLTGTGRAFSAGNDLNEMQARITNPEMANQGSHFTAMIDALAQHKRSEQWQSPKLIPLMTTWLNQERWTQVLPETIPQKRMGDGGRWNCYHDPSCRTISDCSAKIIAEGRAEKAAR